MENTITYRGQRITRVIGGYIVNHYERVYASLKEARRVADRLAERREKSAKIVRLY